MRKLATTVTVLALAVATTVLVSPAGAVAQTAERAHGTPTAFALNGTGYGTRVRGGEIPAGSDTTAYHAIGCTNEAGLTHENHVTEARIPGFGEVFGVTTQVWTTQKDGVVSSLSRNSIARVVLHGGDAGTLEIDGLRSLSHAFHDGSGFHADTDTRIGSLTYTPVTGVAQDVPIPTPGTPITIPGLATIELGTSKERSSSGGAKAAADALLVEALATGTELHIGHTVSEISNGVRSGLFSGRSLGVSSKALDDNVTTGALPLSLMPCQGTDGKLRTKSIASLDLGDNVTVRGVSSRQQADQTRSVASGHERGRVDEVDINDGQLLVNTIVGRANVTRTLGDLTRNAKGTRVGEVLVDGEPHAFPDTGVLEIPGVARLERSIVKRVRNGIVVTALRITLLDGTGAVLNLGQARLTINDSGR